MSNVKWTAITSDDNTRRYRAETTLSDRGEPLAVIVLHPAHTESDDPSLRACVDVARQLNTSQLEVYALLPFRATTPIDANALYTAIGDDPKNEAWLDAAIRSHALAGRLIVAWGHHAPDGPIEQVRVDIDRLHAKATPHGHGCSVLCLGRASGGVPRHPHRLRGPVTLEAWEDWYGSA